MKILVTGSEGSLMQAVIPLLLAQGHTVVGVDNLYRYGHASERANKDYKLLQLDLSERNLDLCKGYDIVFLAAAKIYGVGGFNHYCADIIADDTAIQGNILKSCALHGVKRVVYISSSMVYETCVQDLTHPVTEELVNNCILPKTDYGVSKLIGERMCEAFRKQYGINYTIWRPFNIITPHERHMSEQGFSHVFADFVKHLIIDRVNHLPIIGDGEQIRCFTWIDDIATIIAEHSLSDVTLNQTYNICNVEPISMKQLAEKIYQTTKPTTPLEYTTVKNYDNDVLVRVPSIDKLRTIIGNYEFKNVDYSINQCVQHLQ
jgi:UDP-glucose 4-epimerase